MKNFHIGFTCLGCGRHYETQQITYTCPSCGSNVDATYDYEAIRRAHTPAEILANGDQSVWRYMALLPLDARTLPEFKGRNTPLTTLGNSPLYRAHTLEQKLGADAIYLKDDGRLPSASFKDRASSMLVAVAVRDQRRIITLASSGNAAAAQATMCANTSTQAVIFVPQSAPEGKLIQMLIHGARVYVVRGTYNDAVAMAAAAAQKFGWYNRSTGVNPYTREGKKTAAFEIAAQLGDGARFVAPEVMIVPVGDGNIISGIHKGFSDLHALGWIEKMPRFIGVSATLAPCLYRAWQSGGEQISYVESNTIAGGIGVDQSCDGVAALRAIRNTGGAMLEATDEEMLGAMRVLARDAGVFTEPASAAAYVGLQKALASGAIHKGERIVLQLTGSGLKDAKSGLTAAGKPIHISSIDEVN